MQLPVSALALLLAAALPPCGGTRRGEWVGRHLRPSGDTMVQPFRFDQQLIICNAYPSSSPVRIRRNQREVLADGKNALPFRQCRYIRSQVQPHDKLDVMLRDVEVHGTFEVGSLPTSDAVLLLVLEKRAEDSPLVSFRSYAFPTGSGKRDAQLAVIDAFKSNATVPHLWMEDHMTGKEEKTVSKRVEQLSLNRIYSIEEGSYDASIGGHGAKTVLKLERSRNYVVLRTGEEGRFPESLVLYPEQGPRSGSIAATHAAGVLMLVAVAAWAAL